MCIHDTIHAQLHNAPSHPSRISHGIHRTSAAAAAEKLTRTGKSVASINQFHTYTRTHKLYFIFNAKLWATKKTKN